MGDDFPESRVVFAAAVTQNHSIIDELLSTHSSLRKIARIVAYCLRFVKSYRPDPCTSFVSHQELTFALNAMCKVVQQQAFSEELKSLSKGNPLSPTSKILALSPFVADDGLIRVDGRLRNLNLTFDACHSILLPRNHVLTKRIVEQEHVRAGHAGAQATMATVRQRFWPLALRSTVREIIRSCVTCFRAKPATSEAIMAPLPSCRVTASRPFHYCGVDYAGPLMLRDGKRRNAKLSKAYVAIFVCFATKAVHIELVSDLTSNAFIGALKRLVSRRGKPKRMYSDNGTTFVGADKQLREYFEFLNSESLNADVKDFLCSQEIAWSFIPPNAPHFGGLWEAAVKSAKHHLHRIVGRAHLNFEEMATVLCEVEAILNSRPLSPLSEDPNDLAYLSPGHFLVGTPLNSYPYPDLCDVNENKLIRWQRVEQLRQHFWARWSKDYLHSLQGRSKWMANKGQQLKANQLVTLSQPGLSPLHWLLGRVEEVHTGPDGIARTALVKTAKRSYTRPLTKIAILPEVA